jgi:hypothetical protein
MQRKFFEILSNSRMFGDTFLSRDAEENLRPEKERTRWKEEDEDEEG